MSKFYTATVKLYATVQFEDDGVSDLVSQAADQVNDGNLFDVDINDIEQPELKGGTRE